MHQLQNIEDFYQHPMPLNSGGKKPYDIAFKGLFNIFPFSNV